MTRKPDQRAIDKRKRQTEQSSPEIIKPNQQDHKDTGKSGEGLVDLSSSPADVLRGIMNTTEDESLRANTARALAQIEARAGYGVNKPLHRMTRSELEQAIMRVEALLSTQGIDKLA